VAVTAEETVREGLEVVAGFLLGTGRVRSPKGTPEIVSIIQT
jgi:hypothetical protein